MDAVSVRGFQGDVCSSLSAIRMLRKLFYYLQHLYTISTNQRAVKGSKLHSVMLELLVDIFFFFILAVGYLLIQCFQPLLVMLLARI